MALISAPLILSGRATSGDLIKEKLLILYNAYLISKNCHNNCKMSVTMTTELMIISNYQDIWSELVFVANKFFYKSVSLH